jgi:hypothetical protein
MRIDELLSSLFKGLVSQVPVASGALPHEAEQRDDSRTMENTSIKDVVEQWFIKWNVPEEYRSYWRQFNIVLSLKYDANVPAATSSESNTMWIRPEWANPGVIAHELAHESYSLCTDGSKASFTRELNNLLKNNDNMLRLLYARVPYAKANAIEAHAEIYRYLGDRMPETLKKYYPNLIK